MLLDLLSLFLIFLGSLLLLHTCIRVVRWFFKFPIPHFFTPLIDHPIRRRFWQPPQEMPLRHGIQKGMRVLEVGPGRGRYTVTTAKHVGELGEVVAIDIEPRIIQKLQHILVEQGVKNVKAELANVHELPYETESFDAVYLMSVIGEIPKPEIAFREFNRVLKPEGSLAFSEMLPDPDYPSRRWLTRQAQAAGFKPASQTGNFFNYTLTFTKYQSRVGSAYE
jgi:ubiquinone/menaquinone biosynthesis C-methylase UbiE